MHETRFAEEIVAKANEKIKAIGKKEIKNIVVRVGLSPLSHVTAEGLNHAVDGLLSANNLKKIKLAIKPLPFRVKCHICGASCESTEPVLECPKCDGTDFEVKMDPEFIIDSVDIK